MTTVTRRCSGRPDSPFPRLMRGAVAGRAGGGGRHEGRAHAGDIAAASGPGAPRRVPSEVTVSGDADDGVFESAADGGEHATGASSTARPRVA